MSNIVVIRFFSGLLNLLSFIPSVGFPLVGHSSFVHFGLLVIRQIPVLSSIFAQFSRMNLFIALCKHNRKLAFLHAAIT